MKSRVKHKLGKIMTAHMIDKSKFNYKSLENGKQPERKLQEQGTHRKRSYKW